MTERVLGPTGGRRWRRLAVFVPMFAIAALVLAIGAAADPSGDSGFEGDDGNLAVTTAPNMDWNSFAPTTWTGTAPNRTSSKTVNGWAFTGLEDAQATTSDSAFAGGVKQDNNCPTVNTGKAPNKDDLERAYVASSTVDGDVFLALGWVRIPQNTTSPSAHIGFEFNQGETDCSTGGLVSREEGDLLIVYDFEGSATDAPTITLREWVLSGACEVGNSTAPCWGPATNLTALGYAEGRVNVSTVGVVSDGIAPSPPDSLGLNEFGEAIINLSDAGVFGTNECTAFGNVFAVSRSSGNSGTAQMKDLAGPGDVNLTNCGSVIIRKVTVPSPDLTDTSFGYATTGGLLTGNPPAASFSLKNGGSRDFGSEVFAGSYSVTEDDPSPNFVLTAIDCSASTLDNGTVINTNLANRSVSFDLEALDTVDCTFTNTLQKKETATSTQPSIIATLHDSATVTGDNNPTGNVTFRLFDDDECENEIYSETVALASGAAETEDGFGVTDEGTWYWIAEYAGDTLNDPSASLCEAEVVSIDITP